jgi:ATPase subunit of ABC transporter with duplicated ATPase domains
LAGAIDYLASLAGGLSEMEARAIVGAAWRAYARRKRAAAAAAEAALREQRAPTTAARAAEREARRAEREKARAAERAERHREREIAAAQKPVARATRSRQSYHKVGLICQDTGIHPAVVRAVLAGMVAAGQVRAVPDRGEDVYLRL